MSRFARVSAALLIGVALIWLVQFAAIAVTATPGLSSLLRWLRTNRLPQEFVTVGITTMLPVFAASLLVGLVGFRLPERKGVLFLCLAVPFVAFSLYANVGMFVSAGNSLASAIAQPLAWLVVLAVLLGLGMAATLSPHNREA
jgi:hypothetical protein